MRTLLVSSSPKDASLDRIRRMLRSFNEFESPEVVSYADARQRQLPSHSGLIVVSLGIDVAGGHEFVRGLAKNTSAKVMVVGPVSDSKLILKILQDGADLYIDDHDIESEFLPAITRMFPDSATPVGRVLAVITANGGSGGSTLAVNLAVLLARSRGRCGLVDGDALRGDLATMLDLKPSFSLADACLNEGRLDRGMIEKMLIRHASGVHLLAAPAQFADVPNLTPGGMVAALTLTRSLFPETIVDLGDGLLAEQTETLRVADCVYLVCRLDFTSLRNARRLLDHLGGLGVRRSDINFVASLQGQPGELPVAEAEKVLGGTFAGIIPYDPASINSAINTGSPAAIKFPTSRFVQACSKLIGGGIAEGETIQESFLARFGALFFKPAPKREPAAG